MKSFPPTPLLQPTNNVSETTATGKENSEEKRKITQDFFFGRLVSVPVVGRLVRCVSAKRNANPRTKEPSHTSEVSANSTKKVYYDGRKEGKIARLVFFFSCIVEVHLK